MGAHTGRDRSWVRNPAIAVPAATAIVVALLGIVATVAPALLTGADPAPTAMPLPSAATVPAGPTAPPPTVSPPGAPGPSAPGGTTWAVVVAKGRYYDLDVPGPAAGESATEMPGAELLGSGGQKTSLQIHAEATQPTDPPGSLASCQVSGFARPAIKDMTFARSDHLVNICVRTSEGRCALLHFVGFRSYKLEFRITTWNERC